VKLCADASDDELVSFDDIDIDIDIDIIDVIDDGDAVADDELDNNNSFIVEECLISSTRKRRRPKSRAVKRRFL
jgi:hypothetical protein